MASKPQKNAPVADSPTTVDAAERPVVIVYQNPDFVSGLLQALLRVGLIESAEIDNTGSTNQASSAGWGAKAGGSGKIGAKILGGVSLSGDVQHVNENSQEDESTRAQRLRYVFSDAHYFYVLRDILATGEQIMNISDRAAAEALKPGDIVEFSVNSFSANEINAILDVATPELISTITKFTLLRKNQNVLREIDDIKDITRSREVAKMGAEDTAELGGAIAEALRRDFRSDATREYYGDVDVNDPENTVTAITVCEATHFITHDPDRLLDGQFTVLGKVIAPLRSDVPVLARNKLLDRIDPDFLENAFQTITKTTESQSQKVTDDSYDGAGIDLTFSARVDGDAFSVLPIAIYI